MQPKLEIFGVDHSLEINACFSMVATAVTTTREKNAGKVTTQAYHHYQKVLNRCS